VTSDKEECDEGIPLGNNEQGTMNNEQLKTKSGKQCANVLRRFMTARLPQIND
jgi:hypothetical protein